VWWPLSQSVGSTDTLSVGSAGELGHTVTLSSSKQDIHGRVGRVP